MPKSLKRVKKSKKNDAQTVTLTVHSQLALASQPTTNYIQVNIAPQVAAFSQAVGIAAFYQQYTVQKVKWKIINQRPVNVLLSNGAHYTVPRYYKVDLVNDQIPGQNLLEYLKYEKVSTGLMSGVLTGQFIPYSSVVSQQDRAFKQRQKITTSNLDMYNYGCSVFFKKDVVPALNQLFDLTLIVTATIRFHHFDGVAALAHKGNNNKLLLRIRQPESDSDDSQEQVLFEDLGQEGQQLDNMMSRLTLKQFRSFLKTKNSKHENKS